MPLMGDHRLQLSDPLGVERMEKIVVGLERLDRRDRPGIDAAPPSTPRTKILHAGVDGHPGARDDRHPAGIYDFYKSKMIYRDAKPNHAHLALARLEQAGKLRVVITQNIDMLHQQAGSREVLELHGSVHRNFCMNCDRFFGLDHVLAADGVPKCDSCGGIVKPDVVLYEEALDMAILEKSRRYIEQVDVLIVAGTSLTVYPAAGLIQYFGGNHLVLVNKSPTPYDHAATLVINDSIGETLKQVVA